MRLNKAALKLSLLLRSQKHKKSEDGDKSQAPFRFWER